jgi:transcription initiation factor TFIID subunit 1
MEQKEEQSLSSNQDSDSSVDELPNKNQDRVTRDELIHARCIKDLSYYKLNWKNEDLRYFHRPEISMRMRPGQGVPCKPTALKKEEKDNRLNPHDFFKDRWKLSLRKGKFCVFEHVDQHPLFLNNFGMASRLKRYFYDD